VIRTSRSDCLEPIQTCNGAIIRPEHALRGWQLVSFAIFLDGWRGEERESRRAVAGPVAHGFRTRLLRGCQFEERHFGPGVEADAPDVADSAADVHVAIAREPELTSRITLVPNRKFRRG